MKERLEGLDALRGYAAIGVLLFHARELLRAPWLMPSGYMAVDLFFVMSGFVIAQAYEAKLLEMGVLGFLRVRLIRFYPLLALGLALGALDGAILVLRGQPAGAILGALVANAAFLPAPPGSWSQGGISPIDAPAWSLLFEMWINVAFALALPRLTKRVLAGIVCLCALVLIIAALTGNDLGNGHTWATLWIGFGRVGFSFPLGVLLYRLRDRLPLLGPWTVLTPLVLVAAFMLPQNNWTSLAFILALSPAIVVAALRAPTWRPLAVYGGATSYGLYVLHHPLLTLLSGASHALRFDPTWPTMALLVGLFLTTPLLDRFYDRPARKWLSGLLQHSDIVRLARGGARPADIDRHHA